MPPTEQQTTKRWGPLACQRCGYDQPECTCVGGYVAPQATFRCAECGAIWRTELQRDLCCTAKPETVHQSTLIFDLALAGQVRHLTAALQKIERDAAYYLSAQPVGGWEPRMRDIQLQAQEALNG